PVRDHREMAADRLRGLADGAYTLAAAAHDVLHGSDEHAASARGKAGRVLLKGALAALAGASPLAAALLLVAEGAAGMHEAHKLHRAVDPETQERLAREVVESVRARVDRLPPEVAERVVAALRSTPAGDATR
ncbi:MAG: hypothetical protein QNJ90_05630, partial [Planctomycetota bacterium]|nr:hypothetical protein [Planctomycetota bacterium]